MLIIPRANSPCQCCTYFILRIDLDMLLGYLISTDPRWLSIIWTLSPEQIPVNVIQLMPSCVLCSKKAQYQELSFCTVAAILLMLGDWTLAHWWQELMLSLWGCLSVFGCAESVRALQSPVCVWGWKAYIHSTEAFMGGFVLTISVVSMFLIFSDNEYILIFWNLVQLGGVVRRIKDKLIQTKAAAQQVNCSNSIIHDCILRYVFLNLSKAKEFALTKHDRIVWIGRDC